MKGRKLNLKADVAERNRNQKSKSNYETLKDLKEKKRILEEHGFKSDRIVSQINHVEENYHKMKQREAPSVIQIQEQKSKAEQKAEALKHEKELQAEKSNSWWKFWK